MKVGNQQELTSWREIKPFFEDCGDKYLKYVPRFFSNTIYTIVLAFFIIKIITSKRKSWTQATI